jgi:ribosome-binding ATPase YchF (GTP1/OBG family)
VKIPGENFNNFCQVYKPASGAQAVVEITDVAALVENAHEGQGLGNVFLSQLNSMDGIFHVVRAFEDEGVVGVDGNVPNPVRDMNHIQKQLIMKDLQALGVIELKIPLDKEHELRSLEKAKETLKSMVPLAMRGDWISEDIESLSKYGFLTAKPIIYLVNLSPADVKAENRWLPEIHQWVEKQYHREAEDVDISPSSNLPHNIILYSAVSAATGAVSAATGSVPDRQSMIDEILLSAYDVVAA